MAETVTNSPPERTRRSFGLSQLLVLSAIFAISFACAFPSTALPNRPNPGSLPWKIFLAFPAVIIGVMSLTGASVVVSRWWREKTRPSQPGEWLLLFCAVRFIIGNVMSWQYRIVFRSAGGVDAEAMLYQLGLTYVQAITFVLLAALCVFALKQNRWWWKVTFILLASNMIVAAVSQILISLYFIGALSNSTGAFVYLNFCVATFSVGSVGWIFICLIIDLFKRIKRSWTHKLGVATILLALVLPPVVNIIATRFLTMKQMYPDV